MTKPAAAEQKAAPQSPGAAPRLANRRLPMLAQASSKTSVTRKTVSGSWVATCRFLRGLSIQDVPAAMIWGRCLPIWLWSELIDQDGEFGLRLRSRDTRRQSAGHRCAAGFG